MDTNENVDNSQVVNNENDFSGTFHERDSHNVNNIVINDHHDNKMTTPIVKESRDALIVSNVAVNENINSNIHPNEMSNIHGSNIRNSVLQGNQLKALSKINNSNIGKEEELAIEMIADVEKHKCCCFLI